LIPAWLYGETSGSMAGYFDPKPYKTSL